jgi:hypothetical protein
VATPPLLFFCLLSSRVSKAEDQAPGSVENGFGVGPARKSTRRLAAAGREGAGAERAASARAPAAAQTGKSADTAGRADMVQEGTGEVDVSGALRRAHAAHDAFEGV